MGMYSNEIDVDVIPKGGKEQEQQINVAGAEKTKLIETGVLVALGMGGLYYLLKGRGK